MAIGKKSLFCFGPGYSVQVIAQNLQGQNWTVCGTYRQDEDAEGLQKLGIEPVPFDAAEEKLSEATAILSAIAPTAEGDPVITHYDDFLSNLATEKWLGYLSTTGVYGDTGGEIVDETAPLNPTNDRSRWRVAAEKSWLDLSAHIFRLPGIYGPGRSSLDRLKQNAARPLERRIDYPGHLFSRIHVEDIAQTVIASISQPNPSSIYNLSDDKPAEQQEVETYAATLLGIEPPPLVPFEDALKDMSDMAKSFWHDNRRIDNSKIKSELGVTLNYPNFRNGLKAIYQSAKRSS